MENELHRLATFFTWPTSYDVSTLVLARLGFCYTGMNNAVECFKCKTHLSEWNTVDNLQEMHKHKAPQCQLLIGNTKMNMPWKITDTKITERNGNSGGDTEADLAILEPDIVQLWQSTPMNNHEEPAKFPEYANVVNRVNSFVRGRVSDGHTAEGLADAGWFWIGPGDKVQCFQCGGNLKEWEPEDDPWDEHKRWYANCPYLKKHGPTPSRQLQEPARPTIAPIVGPYHVEPREVKARMDTATVRAIVNMGYPKDRIKMAIEKRLCTTGNEIPDAESLLEALFQLEEAGKHSNGTAASGVSSVPVAAAESRITSTAHSSKFPDVEIEKSLQSLRNRPSQLANEAHLLPGRNQDGSGETFQFDRSQPDEELLDKGGLSLCLLSFYDWPETLQPFAKYLAQNGFFYTGIRDKVGCCYCMTRMSSLDLWREADIRQQVCLPHCPYIANLNASSTLSL